ncbi:hypothetical protein N9L68_04315 [bacterium]|nr:hypothetical protein [bacterium]
MKLEAGKVVEARGKEMQYVRDMRVYDKTPRAQAARKGWNRINTRWIDINQKGHCNPNCRSMLAGNEFNNEQMDGLFDGTLRWMRPQT